MTRAESRRRLRFKARLMVCAGTLIATLTGLCTATYSVAELNEPRRLPNGAANLFAGPDMLIFAVPFGVAPFLIGLALALKGRKTRKALAQEEDE